MTWTERVIGIVFGVLITGGLFLTAAYGPNYLLPELRRIAPQQVLVLVHAAICLFLAWQFVRAFRTGSIKRRRLPPIERRDRPFTFWVYVSSYALLFLMLVLTSVFGPI